jgi:hypothetical protein
MPPSPTGFILCVLSGPAPGVSELHCLATWNTSLFLAVPVKTSSPTSAYVLTTKKTSCFVSDGIKTRCVAMCAVYVQISNQLWTLEFITQMQTLAMQDAHKIYLT